MPRVYAVVEGDCVSAIAERTGHFWQTIWRAPENKALAERRVDPNCLAVGDRVFVPDLRRKSIDGACDARHVFRRRGVPSKLVLRIIDAAGRPRPGVRFTLTVAGIETCDVTDGDGFLRATVSALSSRGRLVLHSDDLEEPDEEFELQIGSLAPRDSVAGAQARLRNLGVDSVEVTGQLDDETTRALAAFQRAHDLEPTGQLDEATAAALRDAHGS